MTQQLFVYGTLRRMSRHPMARFLAERGREDEAAELEARREDVLAEAESAAKIA